MEKLTEKEIEKLDKLLEVELNIYRLYQELINKELNNLDKEDTIVDLVEEETYEAVALAQFMNPNKAILVTKELEKKIRPVLPGEEIDYYLNNDELNCAIKRIISYLKPFAEVSDKKYNEVADIYKEKYKDDLSLFNRATYNFSRKLSNNIEKDNLLILANNITEEIKNNPNLREYLTTTKYEIIYMNPEIEREYLNQDFKNIEHQYLNAKLLAELENTASSFAYDELASSKSQVMCHTQLKKLAAYNDLDFNNNKCTADIIIRLQALRTALVSLYFEDIKNMQTEIETKIENTEDQKIIYKLVENILKDSEKEKNKHRVVSFLKTH